MLQYIVGSIVVLIGGILVYAATKPNTFRLQRSAIINAPSEKIFPFITDLHQWMAWSPWEKLDPQLRRSYGGASQGTGARYDWEGNSKVGTGSMEIMEAAPLRITLKLDFIKPFEAHNVAEFTLEPRDGATNVTWAMYGPQPFMAKVMGLFMNCEKMVGPQFETGLSNLKTIVEK